MAAPISLHTPGREGAIGYKSHRQLVSASLELDTAYADVITYTATDVDGANTDEVGVGAWIDCGGAPYIDVTLAFTHSTDETLTLLPIFANKDDRTSDPTIGAPPPYIPPVAATGVVTAYPTQVQFTKTDWSTTTSPLSSATVKYVRAVMATNGNRLVKLMAKSNGGAGSLIAYVSAATQK